MLVICCFKVFLGWQKKGKLYVCVARTISATSETCWGHRTTTCAVPGGGGGGTRYNPGWGGAARPLKPWPGLRQKYPGGPHVPIKPFWGCTPPPPPEVQLFLEKKKDVAGMTKTRSVWEWKMNTVKVVGLDEGGFWVLAVLCVISIEVDWWCHFEAAYDSARDFNCCAACDRKGPVRLLLRLYCRQQSIQKYSFVFQLLLDEMEQWEERQQLLEAKLDEIRKKPGNSLTGRSFQHPPTPPLTHYLH